MQIIKDSAIAAAPRYNEAEIRFHVLDPIIRQLGYDGTPNTYLILEEKLEYPYVHIGRRSKKDVPLGFADFRAGLKGARGSFVVEAKAGKVAISSLEIEQAHSYAAHAQVGANYFVLCNGSILLVYETLSGPKADPIVSLPLEELNHRFHELENILSPYHLERNCRVAYDRKLKLSEGLGSTLRVRAGRYLLSNHEIRILASGQDLTEHVRRTSPQFLQIDEQIELLKSSFEMKVTDGIIQRDDSGKIIAHVEFSGVTIHNKVAMAIMGIDKANFTTADEFLSTNPDSPTVFESETDFKVSRGTTMPQLFGGTVEMDADVLGNMFIKVAMCYQSGLVFGEYIAMSDQEMNFPGQIPLTLEMDMAGTFELNVDP